MRRSGYVFTFILLLLSSKIWASQTQLQSNTEEECFQLSERQTEIQTQEALTLCMQHANLEQYPKSVVTFSLYDENKPDHKLIAKRHYTLLEQDNDNDKLAFGHNGIPMVIFDEKQQKIEMHFGKKNTMRQPAAHELKSVESNTNRKKYLHVFDYKPL